MNDNPIVASRSTINPYFEAAGELLRRIKWDLHPLSWSSRARMRSWKDRFTEQKAIIVCNGPSLLQSDLTLLDSVYTFGLNKINLLFDKSAFRPSCIVAVNRYVIEQNKDFYNQTDIQLFLDSYATKFVRSRRNVIYTHSTRQKTMARDWDLESDVVTRHESARNLRVHRGVDLALAPADHARADGKGDIDGRAVGAADRAVIRRHTRGGHEA